MENKEKTRIEVEEAILGVLLQHPDMMIDTNEILRSDDFSIIHYSKLFNIMLDLADRDGGLDILLIEHEMKKLGFYDDFGGREKLSELMINAPISVSLSQHIEILKTYSVQKKIQTACIEIEEELRNPEKFGYKGLLDSAQKKMMDLDREENSIGVTSIGEVAKKQIKKYLTLSKKGETDTGIPTGFREYDRITGGLNRSDLLILAARPAMGKTAFALNMATNLAKDGKSVLMFSLEMGNEQLYSRMLANLSNIEMNKIKNNYINEFEMQKIEETSKQISKFNFFISVKSSVTILDIKNLARRFKIQHDLDFIVIDYLQLINTNSKHGSREQEVSEISRSLKNLARELDIPILALSQLSRGVESRTDKRPLLSDLRESGAIEQDADQVMFLFREEYYKKNSAKAETVEKKEDTNQDYRENGPEIAELIIGKHRNGETGIIHLGIDLKYQRFSDVHTKI